MFSGRILDGKMDRQNSRWCGEWADWQVRMAENRSLWPKSKNSTQINSGSPMVLKWLGWVGLNQINTGLRYVN